MKITVYFYPKPIGNGNVSVKFFKTLAEAQAFEKACIEAGVECGDEQAAGSADLEFDVDGELINPAPFLL